MRIPGPALLLPLFLAGCALPPAVTVASLVLDGVSFATTGKSTTDHAISALADEDCALLRAVDDEDICDPDGDVLITLERSDSADEDWLYDAETGSVGSDGITRWGSSTELEATVDPTDEQQPELSGAPAESTKTLGETASVNTALTPGLVGQGKSLTPLAAAIAVAAKPSPRGLFKAARPAPKPEHRQLPKQTIRRLAQVKQPDGQIATYAVIGSFQSSENADRMALSHGENAFVHEAQLNGKPTYRVLVDQPVEQARHRGFSDAWPVRLCATDLGVPPCSHFVVSQTGVYPETTLN